MVTVDCLREPEELTSSHRLRIKIFALVSARKLKPYPTNRRMHLHEAHIVFEKPMAGKILIFFCGKKHGLARHGRMGACTPSQMLRRWRYEVGMDSLPMSLPLLREVLGTECGGIFVELLISHPGVWKL